MSSALVPRLQLLATAVLFSTGGAGIKGSSFDAWQVTFLRSAIAAAALFVCLPAARRRWNASVAATGAAMAVTMILFVTANKLTTAAHAIFLQATAPLYLLLLGPWLLREPIRRRDLAVVGLMVTGLALVFAGTQAPLESAPAPARGNLLAAAASLTWAFTLVGMRSMSRREGSTSGTAATTAVAGNVIAALACAPAALPLPAAGPGDWALIAFLGLFQIGLAYVFFLSAIRRVSAFEAAMLLLLEPALNPLWAWLVHGEQPAAPALAGGALIFLATGLKAWLDLRRGPAGAAAARPAEPRLR
jgi:drug/metabolite transporter (DMT)-like permease